MLVVVNPRKKAARDLSCISISLSAKQNTCKTNRFLFKVHLITRTEIPEYEKFYQLLCLETMSCRQGSILNLITIMHFYSPKEDIMTQNTEEKEEEEVSSSTKVNIFPVHFQYFTQGSLLGITNLSLKLPIPLHNIAIHTRIEPVTQIYDNIFI